ncbi:MULTISPECIES: alkene reductase [Shewanella]|uniref:NADH:flavin oxidoreductase/NADH oxidase n=1 Tax=Shewanella putrefaciens (strain CN-32 / ATCC BAA-453) TaxID=319224 RepID=A4Y906_SHEPC|nr:MULTISPECIES: alkene reductase [Shewanella]MCK7632899.1 alkene reductase [Shewanella sp. JNE17]MCK7647599.1 alkene reductase [Shewanella sp. JNE8]MCK7656204.1 alkene reductase [Shewanella sp. JNE4-2]QGS49175.1 alkene reductase [Shewanella putrefaciens]UPO30169.1 alkene reductase [Shewanella sp. JNE2]
MSIQSSPNRLENLFETYQLNETITLNNRILMAPLTRCMADAELVPTAEMVAYYARRADAGLIITEATIIRPDGQGYPNTPGIFTQSQIAGWRKVTDAVHAKGGKIFVQLWHTGRVAHPHFFGGGDVLAPSAQKIEGSVPRMRELTYVTPKPATLEDIQGLVRDYAKAAENAIEAGFDGVEIHGANGYLIDAFLHHDSNRRTDEYGGTPEKMSRFALEVVDAIIARIGKDRTGLRLSPGAYFNMATDSRDRAVFDYLLPELETRDIAFVHIGIFDDSMEFDYLGGRASSYVRAHYGKTLVGVGSYSAETASEAIAADKFDLIAIGRPFIANPDYIARVRDGLELVPYSDEMLATLV